MKSMGIGSGLKNARVSAGISVKEISDLLTSKGFKASPNTIYSWENENSQPTPDALLFLCDKYGIENPLDYFGYQKAPVSVNPKTEAVLSASEVSDQYKNLDIYGKRTVCAVLREETARLKHESPAAPHLEVVRPSPAPVASIAARGGGVRPATEEEMEEMQLAYDKLLRPDLPDKQF